MNSAFEFVLVSYLSGAILIIGYWAYLLKQRCKYREMEQAQTKSTDK